MALQAQARINRPAAVAEIVTAATVDALNMALAEKGIDADRIISVLYVPGQAIANAKPEQFRVLYREA